MRIGIDATPIVGHRGGVGWHTYHLLHALIALKEDLTVVAYVHPGAIAMCGQDADLASLTRHPRIRWRETGKLLWRWRGRQDGLDLYHGPNFRLQTEGRHGGVMTIHDVWLDRHPEYSPKWLGQDMSFRRTRRMARRARRIIAPSEHARHDILELYGLPPQQVVTIHNGVSSDFGPISGASMRAEIQRRFNLPTERYILFVGGADPRKNHVLLLEAYAACRARLTSHSVLVMGGAEHRFGNIPETASSLGLEERVLYAGELSLADVRRLYAHADVMVYPSRYEGFGMPVLEAMACGTPVIASAAASLPEVAGEAAVLVPPDATAELSEALVRVLNDAVLRETLRRNGLERAKAFTWERAARATFALYQEVCR